MSFERQPFPPNSVYLPSIIRRVSRSLQLKLLGPFEAGWSDGEPVRLSGKKIRALVAYLGVESGRSHSREGLASLLWAETGDERARHNLRQALSKLNRTCAELVLSEGDTLRLDEECTQVDVREFERLIVSDDPSELERAVALYRGDLLEGLSVPEVEFEDWLRATRGRLRDQACAGYERLAGVLADSGRTDEAMENLRARLEMDPACETAHRALMELLAKAGRRSDALRQYQQCSESLERELGVEPSAETKAVYQSIRSAEGGGEAAAAGPRSGPSTAGKVAGAASTGVAEPPSIAVLPFENLSSEEDAYFTDGVTEDIITALSRFGSLLVIARNSSFAFRDRGDASIQQIGEELGAQFILRGSFRRAGSQIRLNVQLLDAVTGQHLWAQRFDRELEDVFLVQDEITETIVSTLAGRVEAARIARARRMPVERLAAYDYVLRGKDLHHRHTPEDCVEAIAMFEQAIEQDPDYAAAHAWLACGLGQAMSMDIDDNQELLARAEEEVERARQLDDNESECHRILAQIFILRHDLARARSHQERALFLNPNDDRSVCAMGTILTLAGDPEEGERLVRKAMRINPYHPENFWFHLARALFHRGEGAEALDALRNITRPKLRERVYRVAANAGLGDREATEREARVLTESAPEFDAAAYVESVPYERETDRKELLEALHAAGF
jgi:TolB-like protein/Tfp pilus assembly protein PilF